MSLLPATYAQVPGDIDSLETEEDFVDMYLGMSQRFGEDRSRLAELLKDSAQIEPVYVLLTDQFNRINYALDSLQDIPGDQPLEAFRNQQKEILRAGLDYLLERRKTVNQLIDLMRIKIPIEEQIIDLILTGEEATIFEITLQDIQDSTRQDTAKVSIDSEEKVYDWRITEEERKLAELRARLDYLQLGFRLVNQLIAINKEDTSVISKFRNTIQSRLSYWPKIQQEMDSMRNALAASDSARQVQRYLTSTSGEISKLMLRMKEIYYQDSLYKADLSQRIARLAVAQTEITDRISNIRREMESQLRWLSYLKSPFSHISLYKFLVNRGPRVFITLLLLVLVWLLGKWGIPRMLRGVVRSTPHGHRKERVETLSRTLISAFSVLILIAGTIIVLSEIGVDVSVLLGGAAVFSLALAFGAQSLVKDYFTGFMILSENQYRIGNVVKINEVSGLVEDMSMRMTILRDLEGIAHFVPHGEIKTVSNFTHSWSRAMLDIGVAYKENVDRVMEVIMEVANELRSDPQFEDRIMGEPEMLGVDAFADSAVVIKLLIQTRPMAQWAVKREFLRRLKNRFDELGIEIPFPHRTIYYGEGQRHLPEQSHEKGSGDLK